VNIYVGNMSFDTGEEDLRQMFGEYGEVTSVRIITDRETGRPRGFGFVEMANDEDAKKAIEEVNGKELSGRTLTVNEARPKRQGGGGAGGGGGGRDRRNRW
jgi:RNA recognition motif-containing protein